MKPKMVLYDKIISARDIYPPFWSYSDIDCLVLEAIPEIAGCPVLGGRPVGSTLPNHERRVSCDITHELEWTGLGVKLLDDRAVELMVIVKKLCHRIRTWIHAEGQHPENLHKARLRVQVVTALPIECSWV